MSSLSMLVLAFLQDAGRMPDNAAYMRAAYAIVAVFYFGYVLLMWRRTSRTRAALDALRRDERV